MKLNLGSGYSGWDALNIIARPEDRGDWKNVEVCELYDAHEHYDFTTGIREADGSVELIWMGDVLEHLWKWSTKDVLADCFRVLKPGGEIWLSVPDAEKAMKRFLESDGEDAGALDLIHGQQDQRDRKNCGPDSHYNSFTEGSLRRKLQTVGFVDIRRVGFHFTWFELGIKARKPDA